MKVYHVETKEDYDALMIELEEKGYKWRRGEKPTKLNEFKKYRKDICVYEEDGEITLSGIEYFKKYHSDVPVIEYKTKGENMKQEKIKQELEEIAALTFHKHGRKPFELKKGDLLYNKNSENNFTYSGIAPNMTINKLKTGEYIFVQTREEVNELLGADDEN